MTASIISHRINDKKNVVSASDVQAILRNDRYHFSTSTEGDFRNRNRNEQAYMLTDVARKELIRETNIKFSKIRFWSKPIFLIPVLFSLSFTVLTIGMFIFHITTYKDVADVSWGVYKNRVSIEKALPEEQAMYLLYFVTEHIKFRPDMTPNVICARLKNLGLGDIKPADIAIYFKKHPKTFHPSFKKGAFRLTATGKNIVKEKLALIPTKDSGLFSLKWFLEYELSRAKLLIPAFLSACLAIWAAGIFYGKLSDWSEKIVADSQIG